MDTICTGIKKDGNRCRYNSYNGFCGIHEYQRPRPPQIELPLLPTIVISEPENLDFIKSKYEDIIKEHKRTIDIVRLYNIKLQNDLNDEKMERSRTRMLLDQVRKNLRDAHSFADELCLKLDLCKIKNVIDNTSKDEDCCICHDNLKNSVITKCCNNELCFDCLCKWGVMKIQYPTCPICRGSLYID